MPFENMVQTENNQHTKPNKANSIAFTFTNHPCFKESEKKKNYYKPKVA